MKQILMNRNRSN